MTSLLNDKIFVLSQLNTTSSQAGLTSQVNNTDAQACDLNARK